jgi:coenzyme F420-dependent glucose-6-phosphate dehydrogenase
MIGLHCSHEQHAPSALLRYAELGAQAGFAHAMCSDHFAPWSLRQGHSGYTWSWLGAALQATPMSFGTVCAPGQRYHPAIIAQAAATLAEMYPQRLWLALGSGEALNESITGQPWPPKEERQARLQECADMMRALWAGDTVTRRGLVTAQDARLYVRPDATPLLLGAAISADTARWVGEWADGMVTVAGPRDSMREVVDAFRETGGAKPMFLQVALSFARTDEEALAAALDQWRQVAVDQDKLAELASPEAFDRESAAAQPTDIVTKVRVSADVERQIAWLHEDAAMGFDRVYVHNVARDHQERFIDVWAEQVLPRFRPS